MLDMTCGLWVWKMWMVWMGAGGCVQVHVRHDESGCGALLVLGQAGPGDKSDPRTKAAMRAGLPTGNLHAEQPAGRPAASPGDPGTRADGGAWIYLFVQPPSHQDRVTHAKLRLSHAKQPQSRHGRPAAWSSQEQPEGARRSRSSQEAAAGALGPAHSAHPSRKANVSEKRGTGGIA
jgi:type IV secretory pathway TrbL component